MNLTNLKSFLPYVMIYFLIFKDPYKHLIPVKEPVLKYSQETTWLLDESNKNTHFSTAYNLKFKEKLQDPNNSFPYFIKAFDDNSYSASTKKIWEELKPLGENQNEIILDKNNSLEEVFAIIWSKKLNLDSFYQKNINESQRQKTFEIIEKINVPENCKNFEMPRVIENLDLITTSQKSIHYTFYLGLYADNDELKTKKALSHCRLLANQPNPVQLYCSVQVYQHIVKNSKLPKEVLAKIENELPEWPHLTQLCTQIYRAQIISSALYQSKVIEMKAQEIDKDLFLDKNIYLKSVAEFFNELEKLKINSTLDKLSNQEKDLFMKFTSDFIKEKDRRPLAEIVLFSGTSTDRHRRLSNTLSQRNLGIYLTVLMNSIRTLNQKIDLLEEIK